MKTKAEVWIPLTQGKVAVIDFDDFEKVRPYKWFANRRGVLWYALTGTESRSLHRFLLDAPPGLEVDHRDGDGLNNRRINLRLATHAQNIHNCRVQKNSSGFKGVWRVSKKWRAQITTGGARIHLGNFRSAEEAARAYDAAAIKYFGDFARINFPDQNQCQSLMHSGGAL